MPDYRRNRVPGGTYFFTVNLLERSSTLLVTHIDALRDAVRKVRTRQPFHIDACAVLPNHLHAVWTLPLDDADYPGRWKAIKIAFAKALPKTERLSPVRAANGERASGSGDTGSTRSETNRTTRRMWITLTSIPQSMGWWPVHGIGRFPRSTATWRRGSMRRIGPERVWRIWPPVSVGVEESFTHTEECAAIFRLWVLKIHHHYRETVYRPPENDLGNWGVANVTQDMAG